MRIPPGLIIRYYELLSRIGLEELDRLKKQERDGSLDDLQAKENLALEIVERYYNNGIALKAKEEFRHLLKQRSIPDNIPEFTSSPNWLPQIMKDTGLTKSTGEAIRLIKQGGVKINDSTVSDTDIKLDTSGEYIIKVGKRRFYKIIIE
jgi:tyrosyl-tRNA synthetase